MNVQSFKYNLFRFNLWEINVLEAHKHCSKIPKFKRELQTGACAYTTTFDPLKNILIRKKETGKINQFEDNLREIIDWLQLKRFLEKYV